jgi:hypothetical protein
MASPKRIARLRVSAGGALLNLPFRDRTSRRFFLWSGRSLKQPRRPDEVRLLGAPFFQQVPAFFSVSDMQDFVEAYSEFTLGGGRFEMILTLRTDVQRPRIESRTLPVARLFRAGAHVQLDAQRPCLFRYAAR